MREDRIIMAGFGGQGVLSVGKLICQAGMKQDLEVSFLPSYGPEMRGGTANCQVIVSDEAIACPLIGEASAVLAFNEPSLVRFEKDAEAGAAVIVNKSIINRKVGRDDVKAYYVPAGELAAEAGSARCLNIVMLGAYAATQDLIARENLVEVVREMFAKKKASLVDMNIKAFELGEKCVTDQM